MRVWTMVLLAAATVGAAATCKSSATDGTGGCVASCQDAISQGGVPCPLVPQAATDYDALYACATAVADAGPPDGGLPLCTSLLAHGPLDPECIQAIEALMPPCSSSYTDCYGN